MTKCCICNKGPLPSQGGVSLYRINAKGVPGIYACEKHFPQTDGAPIDPELKEIVDTLGMSVCDGLTPASTLGAPAPPPADPAPSTTEDAPMTETPTLDEHGLPLLADPVRPPSADDEHEHEARCPGSTAWRLRNMTAERDALQRHLDETQQICIRRGDELIERNDELASARLALSGAYADLRDANETASLCRVALSGAQADLARRDAEIARLNAIVNTPPQTSALDAARRWLADDPGELDEHWLASVIERERRAIVNTPPGADPT